MNSSKQLETVSCLRLAGDDFLSRELYNDAASTYSDAIALLETGRSQQNTIGSPIFQARALCYSKMGDLNTALADVKTAVQLDSTNLEAWLLRARLLNEVGDRLEAMDATQRVLELELGHREANALLKKLTEMELLAKRDSARSEGDAGDGVDVINEALRCLENGLLKGNDQLYEQVIRLIKELFKINLVGNQLKTVATIYAILVILFYKLSDYQMGRSCAFIGLDLLNNFQDVINEKTTILRHLSEMYPKTLGERCNVRLKWFKMALEMQTDPESRVAIELRICSLFENTITDNTDAVKELRACVEVCTRRNYGAVGAKARLLLALALLQLENYEAAIQCSEEAKSEFERSGSIDELADAINIINCAKIGLGDYDAAINSGEIALNLVPNAENLINMGKIYLAKVLYLYDQKDSDIAQKNLNLRKSTNYFAQAINLAISENDEVMRMKAQIYLAHTVIAFKIYSSETEESVSALLRTVSDYARRSNFSDVALEKLVYIVSAEFWFDKKDYEKSINALLQAEALDEDIVNYKTEESLLTLDNKRRNKYIHHLLAKCYMLLHRHEDALLVEENLRRKYFNIFIPSASILQISIAELKEKAVSIDSYIIVFRVIQLTENSTKYIACWLILPNIRDPIKFFIITIREDQVKRLESQNELEDFAQQNFVLYRNNITKELLAHSRKFPILAKNSASSNEQASYLFECLFKYIEPELSSYKCKSFVLVPDGDIYNACFASTKCNDGAILINKYTFSICPAVSMIAGRNEESAASNSIDDNVNNREHTTINKILIIGDPQSNLPFAAEETASLKKLVDKFYSTWNAELFRRSEAQKAEIVARLSSCKLLHIASHANLSTDDFQVLRGAILLAPPHADGE